MCNAGDLSMAPLGITPIPLKITPNKLCPKAATP